MNNALDKMLKGFDADLTKIEKGQFKPGDSSEQPGVTQESPDSSWSMIESFLEKMIADLGALLASSAEADAERSSGEAPTTPVTMGKMTNDRTRMVQLIKRARVLKQTDGIGDFLTRAGKAYKTDDRKLAKARESEPKASPQPPLAFGR